MLCQSAPLQPQKVGPFIPILQMGLRLSRAPKVRWNPIQLPPESMLFPLELWAPPGVQG